MSDFMREEKKSESWSFLPGRYFCVSDYHFCIATLKIFSVVKICLNIHSIFQLFPWQRHPDSAEPEKHPLTVPEGAQVPPMPWSLRSQAGGWSLRFPGFQMDTPLSAIFSHGLFREQPTISSGPGPGGFHSWGLRPLHLQYHAKTAAAFPAGRQQLGFQVFPGASARASSKEAGLMARTKSWSG